MKLRKVLFILLTLTAAWVSRAQDHGHLNVGAAGRNQGDMLIWSNGADFTASGPYVKTFLVSTAQKYLGFFDGNITLTALHSVDAFGDPVVGGPAPGAFLVAEIVSVAGPDGASFGFWETNSVAGTPTFSIPTGTTPTGARFELSEAALGAGAPGGDAFGHIHGRRFTVTKPGIYTVGFRAFDLSTNGVNGGPIHAPSDVLLVNFQANYNIKSISWANGVAQITVGTAVGSLFTLQSNTNLANADLWTDVTQVVGNDTFQIMSDDAAGNGPKFYRVRAEAMAP
jgi:hypothetical protein